MQFLVDTSPAKMADLKERPLVGGQLLTPLTGYSNWGAYFAIDNGAFSRFDNIAFLKLLQREKVNKHFCRFVTIPDIVGNARRTLELWKERESFAKNWPHALVAQNGLEDMDIPWSELTALFIGGGDPWKDSKAVADLVKTAKTFGKWVHVGRVNTVRRYRHFDELGADTCDGSGIAMYDHMLENIEKALAEEPPPTLFDGTH